MMRCHTTHAEKLELYKERWRRRTCDFKDKISNDTFAMNKSIIQSNEMMQDRDMNMNELAQCYHN